MNTRFGWLARGMILALFLLSVGVGGVSAQSPGDLVITKVDENGAPLGGACFDVFADTGGGKPGFFLFGRCDSSDGSNDGTTIITGLNAGNYVLTESVAPDGYVVGARQPFTISADSVTTLTFENRRGGATLTVFVVDGNGSPILGSCFGVSQPLEGGGGAFVVGSCDQNDGSNDGSLNIRGLAPGNYILFMSVTSQGDIPEIEVPFSVDASENDLSITVVSEEQSLVEQLVAVLIEILRNILGR